MRNILLITLIAVSAALSATNKAIPGTSFQSVNDRPVVQSFADSLVGVGDTGFVSCGTSATDYCSTSLFNSIRNTIPSGPNTSKGSSVVSTNPDSLICSFMLMRKDADTSDGSAGIYYNIGTPSSALWSLYGGSVTAVATNVALTKYRVAAPWVSGKPFRPWVTITTTTDTVRSRFVDCGAK